MEEDKIDEIFAAIEVLDNIASTQDSENEIDINNRSHIIAMAMHQLGLDLSDLGFVAEHYVEIQKIINEDPEICNDCQGKEEWPELLNTESGTLH